LSILSHLFEFPDLFSETRLDKFWEVWLRKKLESQILQNRGFLLIITWRVNHNGSVPKKFFYEANRCRTRKLGSRRYCSPDLYFLKNETIS
jgi:hypothetical protein